MLAIRLAKKITRDTQPPKCRDVPDTRHCPRLVKNVRNFARLPYEHRKGAPALAGAPQSLEPSLSC